MDRSRIEMQITAARTHPRPAIDVIERQIQARATRRPEIAEKCYYSVPRGGEIVHGASIKLANIALSCWGNTLSGALTTLNDGKIIKATGFCWDLEINNQKYTEAQRRIVDRHGRPYSYDLQIQTANAAISIAERNAILKVLGSDITDPIYQQCIKVVAGSSKDLAERREQAMKWFAVRGVKYDRILAVLEKSSVDQLDVDDVAYLRGLANAIVDKTITIADAFNAPAEGTADAPARHKDKIRAMADERRAERQAEAEKQQAQAEAAEKKEEEDF
jgi:hypothetical protein